MNEPAIERTKAKQTGQLRWLWLSFFVIFIDHLSKYFALRHLDYAIPVKVLPFLNWVLSFNQGAAFGLLRGHSSIALWLFSGFAIVVSVTVTYWLSRLSRQQTIDAIGLALVLGGALGNLIDRLSHGFVIDFIDFHIKTWHWYTFNVADSAIVVGVSMLFYELFTRKQ